MTIIWNLLALNLVFSQPSYTHNNSSHGSWEIYFPSTKSHRGEDVIVSTIRLREMSILLLLFAVVIGCVLSIFSLLKTGVSVCVCVHALGQCAISFRAFFRIQYMLFQMPIIASFFPHSLMSFKRINKKQFTWIDCDTDAFCPDGLCVCVCKDELMYLCSSIIYRNYLRAHTHTIVLTDVR